MKEHDEGARLEDDVLRVREILQAHTSAVKTPTVETVDGLVQVTVDPQLRGTAGRVSGRVDGSS